MGLLLLVGVVSGLEMCWLVMEPWMRRRGRCLDDLCLGLCGCGDFFGGMLHTTASVVMKEPDAWRLPDMIGNAWERTNDYTKNGYGSRAHQKTRVARA